MTWRALFSNPAVMSTSMWMRHRKFLEKREELFKHDKKGQRFKVGERLWLDVDSSEPEFLEVFPIPGGERVRLFSVYLRGAYEFDTTDAEQTKALRAAVTEFMRAGGNEADEQLLRIRLERILKRGKHLPDQGSSHIEEEEP